MKVEIDADTFLSVAKAIDDAVHEAILVFGEDGLSVRASNEGMTVMILLSVDKEGFEEYDIEGEKLLPMTAENIKKAADMMEETVTIVSEGSRATFEEGEKKVTFSLLNLDADDIPADSDIELIAESAIDAGVLKDNLGHAGVVADAMNLYADEEAVTVEASGDNADFENRIADTLEYDADGSRVRSRFSIDKVKEAVKAVKRIDSSVTVRIGDDLPIAFSADDGAVEAETLVAPRIEEI